MLTPAAARSLLHQLAPAGARWVSHCDQVAWVARMLAETLSARGTLVDADAAESIALLHDLGRCRSHGPFHGWTGFCILRARGEADSGRGCLTHWLKNRAPAEIIDGLGVSPAFADRVYAGLGGQPWGLADSLMSFADASVAGSTIVTLQQRHADLRRRYGPSSWLDRHAELSAQHAADLSAALGEPVSRLLVPFYGRTA